MRKRYAVVSLIAWFAILGWIQPLHAADRDPNEPLTFEDYVALPKLETVTVEVKGTFATTKIETMSFKEVEGVDRYYMDCYTGKGGAMGIKTLVHDYKKVRTEARNLMTRLCGNKKAIVESDLFFPTHFTTQFRCE